MREHGAVSLRAHGMFMDEQWMVLMPNMLGVGGLLLKLAAWEQGKGGHERI